jgi:hypothetical protein
MTDQTQAIPEAPTEAKDPFNGAEPSFEEYSKYREDGTVPERFKGADAKTETKEEKSEVKEVAAPEPAKAGETAEGKEPSTTEQEKQTRERDEKGKFVASEKKAGEEPLFNPEQQKAFDKAFRKREAKLRQEFETRYAQTSAPQATAADKTPETTADANQEPKRPELPKLSTYKGTVEEYDKELAEYPAKLQAFLDAQSQHRSRMSAIEKRLNESETKTIKTHPDYEEEFMALQDDIKNHEEPVLPDHIIKAIAEEAEDPHGMTYYLAKNRDEFRRLAALSPPEALRAVLRLDVKLSSATNAPAPDKKPEPIPKPRPPEPVGARATATAFDVTDEKLDPDEWARQRNAELAKRRGR